MNPSTPQQSSKSGPIGKFLNKIRTPNSVDSPNKVAINPNSFATPTFLQRRSSSRASNNSNGRGGGGILNLDDNPLSPPPQFETFDWLAGAPPDHNDGEDGDGELKSSLTARNTTITTSSLLHRLPQAFKSTSTLSLHSLASSSVVSLTTTTANTDARPSPPGAFAHFASTTASQSTTSLASLASVTSTAAVDRGDQATGGSLSKSVSRGWAKSKEILSRSAGASSPHAATMELKKDERASTDERPPSRLDDFISPLPVPSSSFRNRLPLSRLNSDDRILSSSQPSSFSTSDSTPGLAVRPAGTGSFASQSLRLKRSLLARQEAAGSLSHKPRRAQRVLISEVQQQEEQLAREEDGNEAGSEGGENYSQTASSPEISSSEKEAKSLARLPPPSPGFHGRSRSELVPSSPKHQTSERSAATLTISSTTSLASTTTISSYATRRANTLKPESSAALRQRMLRTSSAPDAMLPFSSSSSSTSSPEHDGASSSSASPPMSELPESRATSSLESRRAQVVERTAAQLADSAPARASLDERRSSSSPRLVPYHSRAASISSPTAVPATRPAGALLPRASTQPQLTATNSQSSSNESIYYDQDNAAPATATMRQGIATSLRPLRARGSTDLLADRPPPPRPSSRQADLQDENNYAPSAQRPRVPFPATAPLQPSHRSVLGETYRATNAAETVAATRPVPVKVAQSYPKERVVVPTPEYEAPVRDSSPGMGEATPSWTLKQSQYASQQQPLQQAQHPQSQQQYQSQQLGPNDAQVLTKPRLRDGPKPLFVNGKQYNRAGLLGKGGSSRVYRVIDQSNNLFAIKRVEMSKNDPETKASFINEISLLQKLRGHPQIIQLVDAEMNEQKKMLFMVMEVGETDLNNLLAEHAGKSISMNFIRYIWEQMLEAVHVMHNENVVHTDLKPANFVLVKGRLKLIDFGISKAIANDTTNIGRDQQIGTANYMPPEALMDSGMGLDGKRLMKLGRAADVWSLGCILHQMSYGRTPFAHISNVAAKIACIQNPNYIFSFPSYACPTDERGHPKKELAVKIGSDLISTMKSCLLFDAKKRATIPDLLQGDFLRREGSEMRSCAQNNPTIDDATMAALVQRIASIAGKAVGAEEGRKLAGKLMLELRATQADA